MLAWLKKKKIVVGTGVSMGILAAFLAMLPVSGKSEAGVFVIDKQNIEEAIKTAINTASILTDEQKQLALQILNSKKLDLATLEDFYNKQKSDQNKILSEHDNMTGILDKQSSVPSFWDEELGNVEDVLNGNESLYDFYQNSQKRMKALDKTNETAAQSAKNVALSNEELMRSVVKALDKSNKAEGNLQAVQAGNAIQAQQTAALISGNELLAQQTAMQAANLQRENVERTEALKIDQNSKDIMNEWTSNITDEDRSQ